MRLLAAFVVFGMAARAVVAEKSNHSGDAAVTGKESSGMTILAHGPDNPRNSEGSFATLKDGRIMFAYSRYSGKDWGDHANARICARFSSDGGATWPDGDKVLVENEGGCNVMSASLLRLQDGRIALFYLRKNSLADCRLYMRASQDEGEQWSDPVCCIPAPGYFVVNNDRVIQLRGGRLVVPAALHRNRLASRSKADYKAFDSRGIAIFFLSDDGGATWRESKDWRALPRYEPIEGRGYDRVAVPGRNQWWVPPKRSKSGLQEPGVVELSDGSLYAWCRTDIGCQYEMRSSDGGETWTAPQPSPFTSPCSPMSMKRIGRGGELLAIWNDHERGRWNVPMYKASSWGRTPLAAAISRDDGKTWTDHRLLEDDPELGFCYTAIHAADDAVLLAYCRGGRGSQVLQDLCIRRVSRDLLDEPRGLLLPVEHRQDEKKLDGKPEKEEVAK